MRELCSLGGSHLSCHGVSQLQVACCGSEWSSQFMHDEREPGGVGIMGHGIGFLSISERLLHMVYLSTWKPVFLDIHSSSDALP